MKDEFRFDFNTLSLQDDISNNCLRTNCCAIVIFKFQFFMLETTNFQWSIECQIALVNESYKNLTEQVCVL